MDPVHATIEEFAAGGLYAFTQYPGPGCCVLGMPYLLWYDFWPWGGAFQPSSRLCSWSCRLPVRAR